MDVDVDGDVEGMGIFGNGDAELMMCMQCSRIIKIIITTTIIIIREEGKKGRRRPNEMKRDEYCKNE